MELEHGEQLPKLLQEKDNRLIYADILVFGKLAGNDFDTSTLLLGGTT